MQAGEVVLAVAVDFFIAADEALSGVGGDGEGDLTVDLF